MSHLKEQFVGAWSLTSWQIESAGKISYPFGENATGQILYTADDAMSATVSAASRPLLNSENPRQASDAQKAAAFASYFHYAGFWALEGDYVIHKVSFSLNPAMQGTLQKRLAEFSGTDQLSLSAHEPLGEGKGRDHVLKWHRAR